LEAWLRRSGQSVYRGRPPRRVETPRAAKRRHRHQAGRHVAVHSVFLHEGERARADAAAAALERHGLGELSQSAAAQPDHDDRERRYRPDRSVSPGREPERRVGSVQADRLSDAGPQRPGQAMRRLSFACALTALIVSGDGVHAQSRIERAIAAADAQAESRSSAQPTAGAPAGDKPAATAMPADPGSVVLGDIATRQRYLDAMQRYYEYRANGYAYRSRVFEWQLLSSRVIFVIVLVLVGAGIYFAAVQFRS